MVLGWFVLTASVGVNQGSCQGLARKPEFQKRRSSIRVHYVMGHGTRCRVMKRLGKYQRQDERHDAQDRIKHYCAAAITALQLPLELVN